MTTSADHDLDRASVLDQARPARERVRVAIVGGGPSGLTAAAWLAGRVDGEVRVIERERATGGIPRHSDHPGYGLRDLRTFVTGPHYARRLTERAERAGAVLETQAQVTGWAGPRSLEVTAPRGRHMVDADCVVLATGARERPRTARRIAGERPSGVLTTGHLQNLVHLHGAAVGTRAVVVGAELVSWSAVLTLREAGCRAVAMTTLYDRSESYAAFRLLGRVGLRVPVLARSRVVRIHGRQRVEAVTVEDTRTGERHVIACDTVITTGEWVPDHELARMSGAAMDRGTRGPSVDTGMRTDRPGVFAIGNLAHPVDTADVAALDGRHIVDAVLDHLGGAGLPPATPLVPGPEFRWVSPQRLDTLHPPRGQVLTWPTALRHLPVVVAEQDGRVMRRQRVAWPCVPGRVFRVPVSVLRGIDPGGGPVTLRLA